MSNFKQSQNSKEHLLSLSTRYNKPWEHKKLLVSIEEENITKAEIDIYFSILQEKSEIGSKNNDKNLNINLKLNKEINSYTFEELKPISYEEKYLIKLLALIEEGKKIESIKLHKRIKSKFSKEKRVKAMKKIAEYKDVVEQLNSLRRWYNDWK